MHQRQSTRIARKTNGNLPCRDILFNHECCCLGCESDEANSL